MSKKYRIDLFEQLERFFSIVFSGEYELRAKHISLYTFLLNQNNRVKWAEWFKCPMDTGMTGSGLRSKRAYYSNLQYLQECGLLKYEKGVNEWKAPRISLTVLGLEKLPQLIPQSEPVEAPHTETQGRTQVETQVGIQGRTQVGTQQAPTIKKRNNKNKTLNSRREATAAHYIGSREIFDLKNYFVDTFPKKYDELKKNYGPENFEKFFKEFSTEHLDKKWRDDDDLKRHVASFMRKRSENKAKVKNNNNDLTSEELQDKYST